MEAAQISVSQAQSVDRSQLRRLSHYANIVATTRRAWNQAYPEALEFASFINDPGVTASDRLIGRTTQAIPYAAMYGGPLLAKETSFFGESDSAQLTNFVIIYFSYLYPMAPLATFVSERTCSAVMKWLPSYATWSPPEVREEIFRVADEQVISELRTSEANNYPRAAEARRQYEVKNRLEADLAFAVESTEHPDLMLVKGINAAIEIADRKIRDIPKG